MGYDKFKGLNQITDTYKKAVAKSLLENELGGLNTKTTGYELSHATKGTSAWSFGGQQLDIGGNKDALNLIKDIAKHEQIDWTASLETALKSNNASLLSSGNKFKLNNALSSDYGKQKINESFISAVDDYTSHINKVEIELQKINPNLKLSAGEKLMLVDYHNQYPGGISLNSTSKSSLIVKMQDYIRLHGDITPEGLVNLFKTTKFYEELENKTSQDTRINSTYEDAKRLDSQTESNQTNENNDQANNDAEYMQDQDGKDIPDIKDGILVADSGQIKTDVNYDQDSQTLFYEDENGNIQQITYEDNSDLLIYGDPANPNKIAFTDENGDYQVWEKDSEGNFVQINKVDYSGTLNTAINQIGSLIIMNNQDFSNVEKIVVSTSVATIADFATYKGTEFNTTNETVSNLQGAVVSFAVSSFFAKNDNISDILGMDGTFVGGLVDFTVTYSLGYYASQAVTDFLTSTTSSSTISSTAGASGSALDAFYLGLGSAVAGYLGSTFANEIMDWDTKDEATGASIGSAIGAAVGTYFLPVIGTFIGSFIGNIIGGIIGGLFGGSKPPPPTANANYEFDEENLIYNLISSSSSDGGNEKAMINIGKTLANHLENMFNLPGGQLVNSDFLPDINVSQKDKTVKINGEKGTFDTVSDMLGNVLITNIPFINVENGDEYILRALNRTNESFKEGNPNIVKGRGDLEEYSFISQIFVNNTNYKNNKMFNKVS